ncbi:hypothetical protein SNEBB_005344 [Seison nebaliae]|nr:hypothetical protein SNEBB_005344 [Seison nebaliae]
MNTVIFITLFYLFIVTPRSCFLIKAGASFNATFDHTDEDFFDMDLFPEEKMDNGLFEYLAEFGNDGIFFGKNNGFNMKFNSELTSSKDSKK